ncbi:EAL domain-containing response regulator [uncultured Thiocystis sp.]|jgi:EAL domain-containing protein (putative c-di-GMP-specific phosphodiesterase class I)|uniref:EAL domain-containing response regulator n=1 Tax=uncultured Thiocystis sp. TaxID=1202134 RepID=UPI0025ECE42A|nr:EAL domain-containing response regulator [uncultured Thiocystis sp.]
MHRTHCLILDDDPFSLALLSHQLDGCCLGFRKPCCFGKTCCFREICTSGPEALIRLEARASDTQLLFLDLNMPDMDGIEFIRRLSIIPYTGALVLVSGMDRRFLEVTERLARAHGLNVLGHLRKPVQPEALRGLLADWHVQGVHAKRAPDKVYDPDEVRCAIAAGELENHYQPVVDLTTGLLQGVETLVRWRHPEDGLVFPNQFIGVAEAHGLIDELTRGVLRAALEQTRRWRDGGLALRVAVNISMDNLARLDFADFVLREVVRADLTARDLILEVTESRLMLDIRTSLDILARLRLKGISLAIDDFGTGHSSLAQLCAIPFDELKIDRSFVHGAHRNPTKRVMVNASISVAQQLNMKTTGEGVEDYADWNLLRRQGCNLAQGYFIARPMPAEELPGWLADWNRQRLELRQA